MAITSTTRVRCDKCGFYLDSSGERALLRTHAHEFTDGSEATLAAKLAGWNLVGVKGGYYELRCDEDWSR